jgi:hypothetical protein
LPQGIVVLRVQDRQKPIESLRVRQGPGYRFHPASRLFVLARLIESGLLSGHSWVDAITFVLTLKQSGDRSQHGYGPALPCNLRAEPQLASGYRAGYRDGYTDNDDQALGVRGAPLHLVLHAFGMPLLYPLLPHHPLKPPNRLWAKLKH